jgi:hypothetical protein
VDEYLNYRKQLGAPVWVGETGEKDVAIYWGTTDYFEANNIGWSFWPWKKMDTHNTPYSIKSPHNWEAIRNYSRKQGADKPAPELAQKAFDELLQNIQLTNCKFYPDVVNALFRRVPGKVEAENYGHEGLNHSYSIKEPRQNSKFYRTSEPVPMELVEPGQAIRLNAGEWAAYVINSLDAKTFTLTIKAKAKSASAVFEISVNGTSQEVTADGTGWIDYKLQPVSLVAGANQVKLMVKSGSLDFDWIEFQ